MSRLPTKDYTYFRTVRGMCRHCRKIAPARVFFHNGQVYQESLCPTCHNSPALIASDKDWYLDNVLSPLPDTSPLTGSHAPSKGCPHDCGPCQWHASPCQLPVISITNACNLRCPICFTYNRPDRLFHMPVDRMQETVDKLIEHTGELDLVNITGGEPTLHPQLIEILKVCKRPEIGRITLNTNGITLAQDPALCKQLSDLGVHVVLSYNSTDPATTIALHGQDITEQKRQAIDTMTKAGLNMTLLHVLVQGINQTALAPILDLMAQRNNILSLTIQTMTYTGQGGGHFKNTGHIPVDLAARLLCDQSQGTLCFDDFVTRPSAHPQCYLICYLLKHGKKMIPFTRMTSKETIQQLFQDSYLMRPGQGQDFFTDLINQLYADNHTDYLPVLRQLIEQMYPSNAASLSEFDRQAIAESAVRTIYIHAHMDEDTFDCSRAMQCPDLVPAEPGRLIPACTYNLFYRMKDENFYVE